MKVEHNRVVAWIEMTIPVFYYEIFSMVGQVTVKSILPILSPSMGIPS